MQETDLFHSSASILRMNYVPHEINDASFQLLDYWTVSWFFVSKIFESSMLERLKITELFFKKKKIILSLIKYSWQFIKLLVIFLVYFLCISFLFPSFLCNLPFFWTHFFLSDQENILWVSVKSRRNFSTIISVCYYDWFWLLALFFLTLFTPCSLWSCLLFYFS